MTTNSIAARFFFQNCSVTIKVNGDMKISRSIKPTPSDVVLNRNFVLNDDPRTFIGQHNEFYQFLSLSSPSNSSLIKKLSAIGYLLCNKLKKGGLRHKGFICVNEEDGSCANGKSLFAKALSKLSNSIFVDDEFWHRHNSFALSDVSDRTTLTIFDGMALKGVTIHRFYQLCTDEWHIARKALPELIIKQETAPYVLITTNSPVWQWLKDPSTMRRFVALDFSSYFGQDNRIQDYFGHNLFVDWNNEQWHLFDNFMLYCIREYLYTYRKLINQFEL